MNPNPIPRNKTRTMGTSIYISSLSKIIESLYVHGYAEVLELYWRTMTFSSFGSAYKAGIS